MAPTDKATGPDSEEGSAERYPAQVQYRYFKARNPEYDANYWRRCNAFYAGGKTLLDDKALMHEVFPPHMAEEDWVYQERCRRAYYIPYPGQIVDYIIASIFSAPLQVKVASEEEAAEDGAPPKVVAEEPKDEFYQEFVKHCTHPEAQPKTFNEVLRWSATNAEVKQSTWVLVDLPASAASPEEGDEALVIESEAAEAAAGRLDAYLVPLDNECVIDWEETPSGELAWALIRSESQRRTSLGSLRSKIVEEYTWIDASGWARYRVERKPNQEIKDDRQIPMVASGDHSFGQVPIVRLQLPDGLWAMGKLESIARTHFNKRCALTWAEYKSLFSVLVAYQASPDPLNPITDDPNRALNQRWGQGRIVVMGEKDTIAYTGPDTAAFTVAMDDLSNERDEMHRVVHQMAQSVDNSGAALQRSGASKGMDHVAAAVVAAAMAQLIREFALRILEMVQAGRKDSEDVDWVLLGLDDFSEEPLSNLMDNATVVDTIAIPSATFKVRWLSQIARRLLPDLSPEELAVIAEELEENISNEEEVNSEVDNATKETAMATAEQVWEPEAPASTGAPKAKKPKAVPK